MKRIDEAFVRRNLPEIPENANKYSRGHLLLIAGSEGMAGACYMAAKSALRSGVGYLTVAVPKSLYSVLSALLPEAVYLLYDPEDRQDLKNRLIAAIDRADAVAAGCGLGNLKDVIMPILLDHCDKKMVLDADALNYVSGMHLFYTSSADVVMTPHEGEMGRLLRKTSAEISNKREEALSEAVSKYRCSILLKGSNTLIGKLEAEVICNSTGNPGMARAGSGDVLTGVIGSFMAQGMDGHTAAACGAFVHGLAGDLAKEKYGMRSMLPTDMIEMIGEVLKRF